MPAMRVRHIVGCMSGTSIDALDAALVRIEGEGLGLRAALLALRSRPLGALAGPIREIAAQTPVTAGRIARVAHELALLHVDLIREFNADGRPGADLVVLHGQTIFHEPPVSWQLCDAALVSHRLGVPVVSDLRAADLAEGGQGAPITPLADYVLFRHADAPCVVLNLGGFCNFTALPAAPIAEGHAAALPLIRGGDICVCNQLLDGLARKLLGAPIDLDGRAASGGRVNEPLAAELAARLAGQARAGRSLGSGDEPAEWIAGVDERLPASDVLRSACEAIARTVAATVADASAAAARPRVLLAGGGVRNAALAAALDAALRAAPGCATERTDACGVPAEAREAVAMAVLGALRADGVAITLPQVTHRKLLRSR